MNSKDDFRSLKQREQLNNYIIDNKSNINNISLAQQCVLFPLYSLLDKFK